MFNNNVSQTYNFQDASQEIIIMLLGAFLLGCLLTWLLSKLFNKDYTVENPAYRYDNQNSELTPLSLNKTAQESTTSDVRIVDKPTNPSKTVSTPDDLTKIYGINSKAQENLKKVGISSFTDLRDIKTEALIDFKQNNTSIEKEIETWPHQANLAAKGEWRKLDDYQGFIKRVQAASTSNSNTLATETDDLTKLEGIDSEVEATLNKNNISTFKQLSHMDGDNLKDLIVNSDSQYIESEAESWPHQAAMAEKGQWEELKIYQDFMHSDTEVSTDNSSIKQTLEETDSDVEATDMDQSSEDEILDENLSDHDDLKRIEGIGPKIEEVLNQGGIYTFSQLYNSDRERLKKLLDDAGSQFRMHDPNSWPHQAGMANRNEWSDLKSYQQTIIQEQAENAINDSVTKKESNKGNKKQKHSLGDDLKKIEGIGPKIKELLNNAGIETFEQLSEKSRDALKELLNEAGPQFRMHEPESWPHQAKLASKEDWAELEKYQVFLSTGRKQD